METIEYNGKKYILVQQTELDLSDTTPYKGCKGCAFCKGFDECLVTDNDIFDCMPLDATDDLIFKEVE